MKKIIFILVFIIISNLILFCGNYSIVIEITNKTSNIITDLEIIYDNIDIPIKLPIIKKWQKKKINIENIDESQLKSIGLTYLDYNKQIQTVKFISDDTDLNNLKKISLSLMKIDDKGVITGMIFLM